MTHTTGYTRRAVLTTSGATLAALSAGCMGLFGNKNAIKLGGKKEGWQGQAPSDIKGKMNPSLTMKNGTTYEITWENLDGNKHALVIEDKGGKKVKATDPLTAKGQTRTLSIKATQELAGYRCEFNPNSMRGKISVNK